MAEQNWWKCLEKLQQEMDELGKQTVEMGQGVRNVKKQIGLLKEQIVPNPEGFADKRLSEILQQLTGQIRIIRRDMQRIPIAFSEQQAENLDREVSRLRNIIAAVEQDMYKIRQTEFRDRQTMEQFRLHMINDVTANQEEDNTNPFAARIHEVKAKG